jgi:predicted phosphoribosyltransferase
VVCVDMPEGLGAIGFFYADFHQVGDSEVTDILARAAAISSRPAPGSPGS